MNDVTLHLGDCLDVMSDMEPNSIHSIVTDPPYGLSFMGRAWDHGVPGVPFWEAALRVAKPGAMMLAFGGTRTFHRLTCAIEDAGWEIRDCLMWLYGSGFPKSHDISKAIDKAAGITEWKETRPNPAWRKGNGVGATTSTGWPKPQRPPKPIVETSLARDWQGWGTALKPSYEPIILAMKPLDGTFAHNALTHGVAGLNIDASRIEHDGSGIWGNHGQNPARHIAEPGSNGTTMGKGWHKPGSERNPQGRWPANLLLDEEAAAALDEMSGERPTGKPTNGSKPTTANAFGKYAQRSLNGGGDTGGASRYFYVAKASRADRDEVNHHPTVKPTQLMRYLVRLVTPPGGTVFDPFMGSGSTGKAAMLEGFRFVGIDTEAEYVEIARRRIGSVQPALLRLPFDTREG